MTVPPQIEHLIAKVDSVIAKYPSITQYEKLKKLEEKTGHSKVYFFGAGVAVLVGLLSLLGGVNLIVDLVGFLYPAYMSFKSMDAGGDDATQWLTYWVVFSFMSIAESLLGFIVAIIPLYLWIKIGAIIYLYYPSTRGAEKLYENVLRPFLVPYIESEKTTKKSE